MLYIDLRPRQKGHSKDGGSVYSIGVGELGWQYGTGLKSHGTATNWRTRRECPVNCMTVISVSMTIKHAIRKIEWVIELLYNSVKTGSQSVGEQVSWRQDVVEKASRKLSPRASGEQERHNADGHKSGGQYVAVLFRLQLPLTHTTLSNKVRGIFFFKEVFARLYYCAIMYSAWICIWLYNNNPWT